MTTEATPPQEGQQVTPEYLVNTYDSLTPWSKIEFMRTVIDAQNGRMKCLTEGHEAALEFTRLHTCEETYKAGFRDGLKTLETELHNEG